MAALILAVITLMVVAIGTTVAYMAAGAALVIILLQSGAGIAGPLCAGLWVLACLYVWKQNP